MRPRTALLLLAAVIVGTVGGLLLALTYTPAVAAPADVTPIVMQRIDAIPAAQPAGDVDPQLLEVAFGYGADYTDAQVAEVQLTADRVREAQTAGVPADEVLATLVTSTGMLPEQAHAFVAAVQA